MALTILTAIAALLAGGAPVNPPAPIPPGIEAIDPAPLVRLFGDVCVTAYPDKALLATALKAIDAWPMTADEVKANLHDDPGAGWYARIGGRLFGVTIETGTFPTCAVRTMTPSGIATAQTYLALIDEYAARTRAHRAPTESQKGTNDGVDTTLLGIPLLDDSGNPTDLFILVMDNYHGRAPDTWRPDAGEGVGVMIRLARQRMAPGEAAH